MVNWSKIAVYATDLTNSEEISSEGWELLEREVVKYVKQELKGYGKTRS